MTFRPKEVFWRGNRPPDAEGKLGQQAHLEKKLSKNTCVTPYVCKASAICQGQLTVTECCTHSYRGLAWQQVHHRVMVFSEVFNGISVQTLTVESHAEICMEKHRCIEGVVQLPRKEMQDNHATPCVQFGRHHSLLVMGWSVVLFKLD